MNEEKKKVGRPKVNAINKKEQCKIYLSENAKFKLETMANSYNLTLSQLIEKIGLSINSTQFKALIAEELNLNEAPAEAKDKRKDTKLKRYKQIKEITAKVKDKRRTNEFKAQLLDNKSAI